MRKYWEFFLQNLNTDLIYRAKFVLSFATHFIVPFTMICIFISLPGNKFAGMTKDQLISYYVFSSFLLLLLDPRIDDSVKTSIQHGDFGRYLIKPIKYWALAVIEDLSHKIIRLVMGMPVLLILVLVSGTSAVYFEWSKIGLFTFLCVGSVTWFCIRTVNFLGRRIMGPPAFKEYYDCTFGRYYVTLPIFSNRHGKFS